MHHPWGRFRELVDWSLHWAELPDGVWGITDFARKRVTLTLGLDQAERRCTIAHETAHIERGPVPAMLATREEVAVDRHVARLLIPDVRALGEALAWAADLQEAADELWVDVLTLQARLSSLHPSERAYLNRRLADCQVPSVLD